MEENSRVRNIKQKFEVINGSDKKLTNKFSAPKVNLPINEDVNNGDLGSDLNFSGANHRANIKRTPAFRRDKLLVRANEKPENHKETKCSIVTNRVILFNKLQNDENPPKFTDHTLDRATSTQIDSIRVKTTPKNVKTLEPSTMYAKVKKPQRNHKPAIKNRKPTDEWDIFPEYKRPLKLKYQTDGVKKVENSVDKKNVRKYSPGKLANPEVYDELSDTLKRVLRSPLPPGPPPKKPPRTFTAKPINSGLVEEMKENLFPISVPIMQRPIRSKTESEIMLKKIESALLRHQNPNTSPQLSVRKVSAPECRTEKYAMINKNGRKSVDRNSSIDLPKSIFINGPRSSKYSRAQANQGKCETVDHIYEDPKTLVTNDRFSGGDETLQNSLYYMSTPIESIVKPAGRPFQGVVEATNLEVRKPSDVSFSEDPSTKIPNDISIENKIKIWMNNAYSKPWVKASDGGSDSDSVMSVNNDDMSPNSQVDTSGEGYDQVTLRRKGYVQRIASKVISRRQSVVTTFPSDYKYLFECLVLIGLDLDSQNDKVPYIKMKYPKNADVPPCFEHMCFPDAHDWTNTSTERLKDNVDVENRSYVVTLTTEAGQRKYVYCRRIKPEGESVSLPLCYCIFSPHYAHEFYLMILNELENRHGQSELKLNKFLKELHDHKFPLRGQSIRFNSYSEDSLEKIREDAIERPRDSRLEDLRLAKTLTYLKINIFLIIFSSMLLERKVILLSSRLSKLSTCIGGLQAALLPFHWQHTLITIVPSKVISVADLCEAPTPYMIGVLKTKNNDNSLLPTFSNKQQIIVVDLDEQKVIRKVGDENSILPSHLVKGVKNALQLAHSSEPRTNNLLACEAFLRLFVELIGHYQRYIRPLNYDCNQRKSFQKESFVKAGSPHSVRLFLEWFVETASFSSFIEIRLLNGFESKDLFEQRCREYYDELNKSKYSKNKKIVRQLGDLIKDWTTTS